MAVSLPGADRGQSPIVGNILLVGIAIVLGAIVVVAAFGLVDDPSAPPQASVQIADGDEVVMVAGSNVDEVLIRDESGTVHGRLQSAGDSLSLGTLDPRTTYSVVAVRDGKENLVRKLTREELVGDISAPSASPASVSASDLDGDGSASDPYVIRTDSELQAIATIDPGAHYRLGNDIDASKTDQWNGGSGFDPIEGFSGTLDGDGHTIFGLTIDRPGANDVGLFADSSGTLRDFSVEDLSVSGRDNVGGVVGSNQGTVENVAAGYQISNVYDDAVVGERNVGGLVGNNDGGTIEASTTRGEIRGDSSEIGGMVGYNTGTVRDSHSTAAVSVETLSGRHVAGLVGTNADSGTITGSSATGDVTVADASDNYPRVGGLVGENFGTIEQSYATGNVTGVAGASSANHNYGGLVGINWDGTIKQSYATGDVITDGRAGALVGRVSQQQGSGTATIVDSYASGNVTSRNDAAGGLVGSVHGGYDLDVSTSFATGAVSGGPTGGLVGDIEGGATVSLTDSYWDTETTGQSKAVGSGTVTKSGFEKLTTSELTGSEASSNTVLDFTNVWTTVPDDYPRHQWDE